MSNIITVTPTAGASTNPLGITFSTSASIEFLQMPEKLIHKDITGLQLTMVDTVGIYLNKSALNALIPWSIIISLQY